MKFFVDQHVVTFLSVFKEIWPRGFRGEVVQSVKGRTDGQGVITIAAHPET